jgi:hypothetical protein
MAVKATKPKKRRAVFTANLSQGQRCLAGIAVGITWTALGCAVASLQGVAWQFLNDWARLQGFFLTSLGTWLLLIARSNGLTERIQAATISGKRPELGLLSNRVVRLAVVLAIGIGGTASLIPLGFPGRGTVLVFMWVSCAAICFAAAAVTLHTLEILKAISGLQRTEIKVYRYAPARTPELRAVVSYFSSFTLLVTIGYVFALLATLAPHWAGSSEYVEVVRVFWPIIYVPTCSVALVYPHVAVHSLIQREKERTLQSCQEDIDGLLARFRELKTEDIDRTNLLAQLFDRIAATPNYVVDFGIAVRIVVPLIMNGVSFFARAALTHAHAGG